MPFTLRPEIMDYICFDWEVNGTLLFANAIYYSDFLNWFIAYFSKD